MAHLDIFKRIKELIVGFFTSIGPFFCYLSFFNSFLSHRLGSLVRLRALRRLCSQRIIAHAQIDVHIQ